MGLLVWRRTGGAPHQLHHNNPSHNMSLHSSTQALENCSEILAQSRALLDRAIRDIPRLKKVLHTQKVYGLVPQLDVNAAKAGLHTETPQELKALLQHMEQEVARLRRRKVSLESKFELQKVRLETALPPKPRGRPDELKLARLRLLQNKKDRLNYSLSRMKLQNTRSRLSFIPSLPPLQ